MPSVPANIPDATYKESDKGFFSLLLQYSFLKKKIKGHRNAFYELITHAEKAKYLIKCSTSVLKNGFL